MHLRNLKIFCDVVNRRSFSKAAVENDITQGGASQTVQQLEEHLQVQLIDRSKRPFLLTAEGSAFYAGCVRILRQFEQLTEEVRAISSDVSGRASVAAIYSVGLSYLPRLQRSFKQLYPTAEVRYPLGQPEEVYRMVEQGTVDFGWVSYPENRKNLAVTAWRSEEMQLIAPAGHPLSEVGAIEPKHLEGAALSTFADSLRIRHEIDRLLRQRDVEMHIVAELDNIDSVKHAMVVNSAVAFLPAPTVEAELSAGDFVRLDCPWFQLCRPLGIIQRRDATLGRTARALKELILSETFLEEAALRASKESPSNIEDGRHNAGEAGKFVSAK